MAIFEVSEIRCRFKFQICVKGHPLGSEILGKVGLCVAIFEIFEIKCKAKFLVYKCLRPYLNL